ncbi:MAG: ribosome small subunit-dependent GTPase A [Leptonema sp. (in: bacteria)]
MDSARTYRLMEIHGSLFYLLSENLEKKLAVLRGKMRILKETHPSGIPYRNPLSVGDYVLATQDFQSKDNHLVILEVLPRKQVLIRSTPTEIHLLGSNLDYAVCTVSFVEPDIRTGFIDRFLISCLKENIKPILFFTKCDRINKDNPTHKEYISYSFYYKKIVENVFFDNLLEIENYKDFLFFLKSSEKISGFKEFRESIKKGTILLVGQSGTGKSTLLNLILGTPVQKTSPVSKTTKKGKHTTTTSTLFAISKELSIIDSPGIKEWGLNHLTKKEIIETYPEWKEILGNCKFKNCSHIPNIEGCAIQEAISNGSLPIWRKENLDSILNSIDYYEKIRPGDYKKSTGRFHNTFYNYDN